MLTVNISIYDKKIHGNSNIESFLKNYAVLNNEKLFIDKFDEGSDLILNMKSGAEYNLIFIYCRKSDGEDYGFNLGNKIREELNNQSVSIVYIEDYQIKACNLIESRPLKLITEPIKKSDIFEALALYEKIHCNCKMFYKVKNNNDISFVLLRNILYVSSIKRKLTLVAYNKIYSCYGKISDLANISGFVQVHKSFIINVNHIKKYNYKSVIMANGETIPISQSLRPKVKSIIDNLGN